MSFLKLISALVMSLCLLSLGGCGGGSGSSTGGPFGGGAAGVITYGALPAKSATVDSSIQSSQLFQQEIPVTLTDANGAPRVGIPVTLSFTQTGATSVLIAQPTMTTDNKGVAIFSSVVTMPAATAECSVIYKATTNDAVPVVAYASEQYSVAAVAGTGQSTMLLTTDRTTYDVNSGSVLATAKLVKNGVAQSGVPVTFNIVASVNGPATIESGLMTVPTDSNGVAITRITTGTVQATTNVIVQATAATGINATATFQIVPTVNTQKITLVTDRATVDANSGQVVVTATVTNNGVATPSVPVTFSIVSPTNSLALIEPGLTTVNTDFNGVAKTLITTSNSSVTTSVIVQGRATINGQVLVATTTFQIVRGAGVITFGSLVPLTYTATYNSTATFVSFNQLIPFKLTDSNGNPRVGVPVTLDIFSVTGLSNVSVNDTANLTVPSDATGSGVFNLTVTIPVPVTPGFTLTGAIVFRAVTADPVPVIGYVGLTVSSSKTAAP